MFCAKAVIRGECRILKGVNIGEGTVIEGPCVIGMPPIGKEEGELETRIGKNAIIRPFSTIYSGNIIGDNFRTGQGTSIRENNIIGDNVSIGTHAILEFGNRIGNYSRIHSGCFLEMTQIGEHVFVGPNVTFTDDPHPMNCPKYQKCKGGAVVNDLARIGANSTILPGVIIGRNSLVGAGSVVCDEVLEGTVVAGSPAMKIKMVADLKCDKGFFEKPYSWKPYI